MSWNLNQYELLNLRGKIAKNVAVNHKLSKGESLVEQSRLTGCQDLDALGQNILKASFQYRHC